MKLLSFEARGSSRFGVVSGDGVIDLSGKLGAEIRDLRAALAAGALGRIGEIAAAAKPDFALSEIEFLVPIPFPEKIICVGVNTAIATPSTRTARICPGTPAFFSASPAPWSGTERI